MTVQRGEKGREREFSWNSVPWENNQEAEAGEWQVNGLRYRGKSCLKTKTTNKNLYRQKTSRQPPSNDLMERLPQAAQEGPPAGSGSSCLLSSSTESTS